MQDSMTQQELANPTRLAIGIVARNEESGLGAMLESLFAQTIFEELNRRGWKCEIHCLANGCTDRTVEVAAEVFDRQQRLHPQRAAIRARVFELRERGKINAWNQFVHGLSPKEARFLFLMDADILMHRPDTLWRMLNALEEDREAHIAVDRPRKHILFKRRKSIGDWISLAASRLTSSAEGQLCGQLYCIRSEIARKIYLPKDLAACEDGFIKTLVCTDFLTKPSASRRIRLAEGAEHTFEAYVSPTALVRNQKRQIMGQTIVHILVDRYLKSRPLVERERLAETLQKKDHLDPLWLKRLIDQHLRQTRFWWHLYPGLGGGALRKLKRVRLWERVTCFPAAMAGSSLAMISGLLAFEALKEGCTDYWPQAQRRGLEKVKAV
jgi:glycosyltransferase involved in cell wall biosynthesis